MPKREEVVQPEPDVRQPQQDQLSPEELEQQEATDLPDRDAMSLINANIAIPINAAIAANVLSDGATAFGNAIQQDPIDQST